MTIRLAISLCVVFLGLAAVAGAQDAHGQFIGEVVATLLPDGRNLKLIQDFGYVDPTGKRWEVPAGTEPTEPQSRKHSGSPFLHSPASTVRLPSFTIVIVRPRSAAGRPRTRCSTTPCSRLESMKLRRSFFTEQSTTWVRVGALARKRAGLAPPSSRASSSSWSSWIACKLGSSETTPRRPK